VRARAATLLLCLLGTGCMPVYSLRPGEPSVTLQLAYPQQAAWICDSGPRMRLRANREGVVRIPAERRITLGVQFVSGWGYPNAIACSPSVHLVAQADAAYYQHFELDGLACHTWVYRQNPQDPRTGLAHAPGVQPGRAGCVEAGR
jgi:hypothetical protein